MKQPLAIDKLHNVYVNEVNRIENKSLFITLLHPTGKYVKISVEKEKLWLTITTLLSHWID